MIIKSYELKKFLNKKINIFLFYGQNSELIDETLQKEITPEQVYQCMIAVKLGRLIHSPKHEDSAIDICGYGALLGESDGKS